jgi:chromosome segregation ATPase
VLEGGLETLQQQLKQTHWEVYKKIRQRFSHYFDDLVQLKDIKCDLIPVTTPALPEFSSTTVQDSSKPEAVTDGCDVDALEDGFKIVLLETRPLCLARSHYSEEPPQAHAQSGLGVQGLSGGQQALLGLALVFSCALSSQRSPVYFLDEVSNRFALIYCSAMCT